MQETLRCHFLLTLTDMKCSGQRMIIVSTKGWNLMLISQVKGLWVAEDVKLAVYHYVSKVATSAVNVRSEVGQEVEKE